MTRFADGGFTLIELLVSMTFLVILMLVVTQVVGIVQRTWVRSNSRVSQFREARTAFDVLTRTLSQATLNTYWDNEFDPLRTDSAGQSITRAKNYVRQSELQFVCGPTTELLDAAGGQGSNYPGHAVFFQAPLGVTRLTPTADGGTTPNTENMVNLLCGRGYFVEWGDDAPFRPPFLNQLNSVPTRSRLRLMEYSPTAEMNRIYDSALRPLVDSTVNNGGRWFNEGDSAALNSRVTASETTATRAFTRPIAENILALVISPQIETTGSSTPAYSIAPNYLYDSTLLVNPGASASSTNPQGTQHLLPPLLKLTMIALDERSGEFLSRAENESMRGEVLSSTAGLFRNASSFTQETVGVNGQPGTLAMLLQAQKLNYRVFTTTIALKQGRWSF